MQMNWDDFFSSGQEESDLISFFKSLRNKLTLIYTLMLPEHEHSLPPFPLSLGLSSDPVFLLL